jgi:hypothetical protein
MRNSALVLTLASMTSLLAQSSPSYRVTHTYGTGTTSCPIRPITVCLSPGRID